MIIIPRTVWQSDSEPITGSPAVPLEWRYNTLHYCGVDVNVDDPVRLLRNMQSAWLHAKGYSLGYNFAVFPNGVAYQIRGFDIRCAANGDQSVNRPGVAILLAVPAIDGLPSPAMVYSVRGIVALTRDRVAQHMIVNGHRDVRPQPTACPGQVIMSMIWMGSFEPELEEETTMLFRTTETGDAIYSQGSDMAVRHVTAQEGAIAYQLDPSWADAAPTLVLPADVIAWLGTL